MHDEASDRGTHTYRQVTRPSRAFFLLARPTQNTDQLPSSIGERDVFFGDERAGRPRAQSLEVLGAQLPAGLL